MNLNKVVNQVPQLKRGAVWCVECGYSQKVRAAECMTWGWPKHCGATMTIDSPAERTKAQERSDG